MGNFHNLLINRRSIRKYKDAEISAESVKTILETALISPTSKNKMPWEFVVVEDKDMLSELSKCKDFGAKDKALSPDNALRRLVSHIFSISSHTLSNRSATL